MIKKILAAAFIFCIVNAAIAQSKEETAVAAAIENLRKAMVDANKADLEKYTAADLSYGHSSGKIETKAEFVESLATGKSDFVTLELTDQTVKVVGNTAIVRHTLSGSTNDNGRAGTVKLHVLTTWQKQGGQWKLLARQAVRLQQ